MPTKRTRRAGGTVDIGGMVTSGSTLLDLALGGGFFYGQMVNLVGPERSAKTLVAIETLAHAVKAYGAFHNGGKLIYRYNDLEGGVKFNVKKQYNFDLHPPDTPPSVRTVEEFDYDLDRYIKKLDDNPKHALVYVVDSSDSLKCDAETKRIDKRRKKIEAELKKTEGETKSKVPGSYGAETAKLLKETLRNNFDRIKDRNILIIIISQVIHNMEQFSFAKWKKSGGKGIDHWSSQVVWFKELQKIKKVVDGSPFTSGTIINAKVTKNRFDFPNKEAFLHIFFRYGIDRLWSDVEFLGNFRNSAGTMTKNPGKFKWKHFDWSFKDIKKIIKEIETTKGLRAELRQAVIEKYRAMEEKLFDTDRVRRF